LAIWFLIELRPLGTPSTITWFNSKQLAASIYHQIQPPLRFSASAGNIFSIIKNSPLFSTLQQIVNKTKNNRENYFLH
jgi:hypothetical protein